MKDFNQESVVLITKKGLTKLSVKFIRVSTASVQKAKNIQYGVQKMCFFLDGSLVFDKSEGIS